jgi:hypothetical protein
MVLQKGYTSFASTTIGFRSANGFFVQFENAFGCHTLFIAPFLGQPHLYHDYPVVLENKLTSTMVNLAQLAGLRQAVYVMGRLARGNSEEEIVRMLGGDEQLFDMWKSFLKHNQWATESIEGWSITPKGTMWSRRFVPVQII